MKIHFVGKNGSSMGQLMDIARGRGDSVSGSDVLDGGHSALNICPDLDLVVHSAAIDTDNIELKTAKALGIKILSRGEFLSQIMSDFDLSVAVAGAHGKSSVCAMLKQVLVGTFGAKRARVHFGADYKVRGGLGDDIRVCQFHKVVCGLDDLGDGDEGMGVDTLPSMKSLDKREAEIIIRDNKSKSKRKAGFFFLKSEDLNKENGIITLPQKRHDGEKKVSTSRPSKTIFVTEACEYKRSFLSLFPSISVLLNVDLDHTDCYKGLKQAKEAFFDFLTNTSDTIVLKKNDLSDLKKYIKRNSKSALKDKKIITVGQSSGSDFWAQPLCQGGGTNSFLVFKKTGDETAQPLGKVDLKIHGLHSIINALFVIAICDRLGLKFDQIANQLSLFSGLKRRLEPLYKSSKLDIFSDYAHHPTEIKATLSTLSKCGYAKTIAIFEPHTYTRTKSFAARFAKELTAATQVILLPVFAARERFDIFNKTHAGSDQILNKFKGQKFFSACLAKNYDEAKAVLIESLWGQRTDNNTFGAEFDKFKDFGTASSCLSKNCANANEVPIDGKKKGKTDDNSFDNFNSFNHTCKGKGQDGGKIGDKIESKGQDGGGNWSKRGGNWSKDGGEIKKATAAAKTTAALKEYIKAAAAAAKTAVVFLGAGTIDDFAREFANFAKELK